MKNYLIIIFIVSALNARLIPTPFITDPEPIQRAGYDYTFDYFDKRLIGETYGIAMVKPRGMNSTLLILSDESWDRLLYMNLIESSKQDVEYLRAFGEFGSGYGQFHEPKGLCIDTTVYGGNTNEYAVYVADQWNSRVIKLKYLITQDTMISDGILLNWSEINNPTDIACVSKSSDGAYIVVVEKDKHRIRLYQRDGSGILSFIQNYGTEGTGYGQFSWPQGVAICRDPAAPGEYYIYIADKGNNRIVCLRFQPEQGITWMQDYKETGNCGFYSVTTSQYYCVYATAFYENKIYVFTQGLSELLYTYGNPSLLDSPKDVYIDWDRIGLTERWAASTGIQYFQIIPEIREFYPDPNNFDATVDSVRINFKVYETKHYLTMTVAGRELFTNQEFVPGSYSVYWDGRDAEGKVVLPGEYAVELYCGAHLIGNAVVAVKGTKVENVAQGHWTPAGNPYVLVGDCVVPDGGSLTIDPGILIMGYDVGSVLSDSGVVTANGTEIDSIIFTAHRKIDVDPTYPGMWKGLIIDNSESQLKYCNVEYAGAHDSAAVFCTNSDITPVIDSCHFLENNVAPMRISAKGIPFISGNTFENNGEPVIEALACDITEDAVWYAEKLPYRVIGSNLSLLGNDQDTVKLSILPGVELRFEENALFNIGGSYPVIFDAAGKPESLIVFTADVDTLYWKGLKFNGSTIYDTFNLCNSVIEKAGSYLAGLEISNNVGIATIDSCKICKNAKYGVWLSDARTCNLAITNSTFEEDSIPARCLFTGAFGFGEGNEYLNNTINKIEVLPADLTYDMTIQKQGIPYWFRKTDTNKEFKVYVDADSSYTPTLTIEPGTMSEFDDSTVLRVGKPSYWDPYLYRWFHFRGRLICEGIENDTIKLSLADIQPLGLGSKPKKESDVSITTATGKNSYDKKSSSERDNSLFWCGLRFEGLEADTSKIKYTSIEYAGLDTASILFDDEININITDTRIYKSKNYGIWMAEPKPNDNFIISNCLFEEDSVPISTSFNNLNGIYTCSFLNNKIDAIEVLPEHVRKNLEIRYQEVPYHFLKGEHYFWGKRYTFADEDTCFTLTVQPGTQILFGDSTALWIGKWTGLTPELRGRIIAQGTEDSMIVFSAIDTTLYWRGIRIYSPDSDTSQFKYCEISYGGQDYPESEDKCQGNIASWGDKPYIVENCDILRSYSFGCGSGR